MAPISLFLAAGLGVFLLLLWSRPSESSPFDSSGEGGGSNEAPTPAGFSWALFAEAPPLEAASQEAPLETWAPSAGAPPMVPTSRVVPLVMPPRVVALRQKAPTRIPPVSVPHWSLLPHLKSRTATIPMAATRARARRLPSPPPKRERSGPYVLTASVTVSTPLSTPSATR